MIARFSGGELGGVASRDTASGRARIAAVSLGVVAKLIDAEVVAVRRALARRAFAETGAIATIIRPALLAGRARLGSAMPIGAAHLTHRAVSGRRASIGAPRYIAVPRHADVQRARVSAVGIGGTVGRWWGRSCAQLIAG